MSLSRTFIRNNITSISIGVFLALYSFIIFIKPGFMYNHDGSLRQFGLNSNQKTILPVWSIAILLSIIAYFFVLYYLAIPRIQY